MRTAYCDACALVLPTNPFMNVPDDDPNKPFDADVPAGLISEKISVPDESGDEPYINELKVCVMAYSTFRNAFWAVCAPVAALFGVAGVAC